MKDKTKKLISIFEKVQKIPYKVCKFDEREVNEKIKCGDCRHKSTLLFNLLKKEGFEVKKVKVLFDWKELPLPNDTISTLKESSKIWDHDAVMVKINKKWKLLDCTWDPSLYKIGFPVTKNWDGKSDTLGITTGNLKIFDANNYIKDKEKIKIIKEEAYLFADKLNKLFEGAKKMKKPKLLYHGSGKRLEVLEPRKPTGYNPCHDKRGVYATDSREGALGFSAKGSAKTSGFRSRKTGIHYIYEGWPNLNATVYLHIFDSKDFEYNAPNEYTCPKKVKPIKIEAYKVSDLQHLFRKATKKDLKEFLKDRDAWTDPELRKSSTYKFVIRWRKDFYDCEWSDDTDFENLPKVHGVHAFIFNDKGEICIAKWKKNKYWGDIGGGPEKCDKTFEDTLIREADEEADLDLKDIKRVGYFTSTKRGTKDTKYSVNMVAKVKKIKPQTIDPACGEIPQRKFIKPKDFNKYCNWGENGEFQIKKALEKLRE